MKKLVRLILSSCITFSGCVHAPERFVQVAETTIPQTVMIYVSAEVEVNGQKQKGAFAGAGVFIDGNNHILTVAHLFSPEKILGVTVCDSEGQCVAGELLAAKEEFDLALVQSFFDKPHSFPHVGDPRELRIGQEVLAIGNPLQFDFSVCHGIISGLNRDNLGAYNLTQSDAMINPGNSGGPLFNLKGELIGINSRIVPVMSIAPLGLGFSVQSGQIIEFLTDIRKKYDGLPHFDWSYWL